jgi:hypothetical protein
MTITIATAQLRIAKLLPTARLLQTARQPSNATATLTGRRRIGSM